MGPRPPNCWWAVVEVPMRSEQRFEPEPSGQDRRPVPDYVRTWIPLENLVLSRRFPGGRLQLYRYVLERLPIISDAFVMTGRILGDHVGLNRDTTDPRTGARRR